MNDEPKYWLYITFRSNERPFSTNYDPVPGHNPKSDVEAIEWAQGMYAGLNEMGYDVTLLKDGQPLTFVEDETEYERG